MKTKLPFNRFWISHNCHRDLTVKFDINLLKNVKEFFYINTDLNIKFLNITISITTRM